MEGAVLAALGLLGVVGLSLMVMYNRFVSQRNLVEESWAQVDVELTRRHDLIPNLVETVEGHAAHERAVLEQAVRAREEARTHRTDTPRAREGYEDEVTTAVHNVLARAEDYPDLTASRNFLQLQEALTITEDRIAAARRFYNGNVRALNTRVGAFPSNLVAGMFGFDRAQFFELRDPAAAEAPRV